MCVNNLRRSQSTVHSSWNWNRDLPVTSPMPPPLCHQTTHAVLCCTFFCNALVADLQLRHRRVLLSLHAATDCRHRRFQVDSKLAEDEEDARGAFTIFLPMRMYHQQQQRCSAVNFQLVDQLICAEHPW